MASTGLLTSFVMLVMIMQQRRWMGVDSRKPLSSSGTITASAGASTTCVDVCVGGGGGGSNQNRRWFKE